MNHKTSVTNSMFFHGMLSFSAGMQTGGCPHANKRSPDHRLQSSDLREIG